MYGSLKSTTAKSQEMQFALEQTTELELPLPHLYSVVAETQEIHHL